MHPMKVCLTFLLMFVILGAASATAEIPRMIHYQGRLLDSGAGPVTDTVDVRFRIYESEAAVSPLWEEYHATIFDNPVAIIDGFFNVLLGSNVPIPDSLSKFPSMWLGIKIGGDPELSPRNQFSAVPYALQAAHADTAEFARAGLGGGDITSVSAGSGLSGGGFAGAVTLSVQPNGISSLMLTDGGIVNADISPAANISSTKIAGTAATLGAHQTFTGNNTFAGNNQFSQSNTIAGSLNVGDSSLVVNNDGIVIGTNLLVPNASGLLRISRTYADASVHRGIELLMTQTGTGEMRALSIDSETQSDAVAIGVKSITTSNSRAIALEGYGFNLGTNSDVYGVFASGTGGNLSYGIYATASGADQSNYAGYFEGDVHVTGTLSKSGGTLRIDHPLDPENMYLQHSSVESTDMLDIYNGNVATNATGYATVTLPDWFQAINRDFRYQLTVIGEFAQAIVAEEVRDNQFTIRTDKPNVKVSWQLTGIRDDAFARMNRIEVEVPKNDGERGKYLHPEAWGQGPENGINWGRHKQSSDDPITVTED